MKAIVTTTINEPTKALLRFVEIAERDDWVLIIVGDQKTPHDSYLDLAGKHECVAYVHPNKQESKYKKLSDLIGWNCIQRRNIGFIEAYNMGAEIIATVDDDNIPYENWGLEAIAMGDHVGTALYQSPSIVFDPLMATEHTELWHRGFPIQLVNQRSKTVELNSTQFFKPKVIASLWNGEPDVDAVVRIARGPFDIQFKDIWKPFAGTAPGPFNSQNTMLARECFPDYFLFPHIGRMDDIWASYLLQSKFPESVIYGHPTVYQERNDHDLSKDLENEMIGYKNTLHFVNALFGPEKGDWQQYLPTESIRAYEAYREYFKVDKTPYEQVTDEMMDAKGRKRDEEGGPEL